MYIRIGAFFLTLLAAFLIVKLYRSRKFDTFCKNLSAGKLIDPNSKDVMDDIKDDEDYLKDKVKTNTSEVDDIKKDSDGIEKFLGDRDGKKNKKKKKDKGENK